ncbi:transposase family protein [Patescibacteria group bacterium]|nr:transposase family protein [Patescibacteria group bacterium]
MGFIPERSFGTRGGQKIKEINILFKTIKHFFPDFHKWLENISDPRMEKKCTYRLSYLLWVGLFLFLLKAGARRNIKFFLGTEAFAGNVSRLMNFMKIKEMQLPDVQQRVPHGDTINYLLERIYPQEISGLRENMVRVLIRNKVFLKDRLFNHYIIVVDGTRCLQFKERHCAHCLKQKSGKEGFLYFHPVLEAKLVSFSGLAFSIATEFIENDGKNNSPQDCELKAFYRLANTLKMSFPHLKICLVMDSLYAGKPTFDICQKNHWKYIITLKEGSLPSVYKEYEILKRLSPRNMMSRRIEQGSQDFFWVSEIDYYGHQLNVLECIERREKTKRFLWLTNLRLSEHTCNSIAKGGRLRWKIENEGFNTQKNGGYGLEHPYSLDNTAIKNFYLLLQIAHTINQLMEKGSLLKNELFKFYGSIKNFTQRLCRALISEAINPDAMQDFLSSRIQIRFDTT